MGHYDIIVSDELKATHDLRFSFFVSCFAKATQDAPQR